jgi:hypothetical protein
MARRARVHSRDLQPQIAAPKGLFAAARVQRFEWPATYPTTSVDELGNVLHVGTTTETPQVTVTLEAFDVSHNIFAYMTGYTPGTFPVSGASITELKNVDMIGQIRNTTTKSIVNALYVKRGIVTAIGATFGVRANSTETYTVSASSKKELRQPVFYDSGTISATSGFTLSQTPTYLTRTSGYTLDAYRIGADGSTNFLDEGTDYTVTGTSVSFTGANNSVGDTVWVTYSSTTAATFKGLDTAAPAAIQGKYVPVTISVNNIPRVQSATINVTFPSEEILEMGGLGKPVGYELGIPEVTGEIQVLKTDNDLMAILEGVSNTTVENDMEYAKTTLPLKIELKDPRNPARVVKTYYVPSLTFTAQSDTNQVNQSMNETYSFQSTTGDLFIASGSGVY